MQMDLWVSLEALLATAPRPSVIISGQNTSRYCHPLFRGDLNIRVRDRSSAKPSKAQTEDSVSTPALTSDIDGPAATVRVGALDVQTRTLNDQVTIGVEGAAEGPVA